MALKDRRCFVFIFSFTKYLLQIYHFASCRVGYDALSPITGLYVGLAHVGNLIRRSVDEVVLGMNVPGFLSVIVAKGLGEEPMQSDRHTLSWSRTELALHPSLVEPVRGELLEFPTEV